MAIIDNKTPNLGLLLPDENNDALDDIRRIKKTITDVDQHISEAKEAIASVGTRDLGDNGSVTVTAPKAGEVLRHDGQAWKNDALTSKDVKHGTKTLEMALAQLASQLEQLLGGNAPELLDTIQELANALGDDPNFAATVMEHQSKRAVETRMAPEGGKPQYFDPTRGDGGAWVDIGSGDGVPVGGILGDPSGTGFGPGWLKLGNGATFDVTIYKKLALKYPDGVLPDPDDRVLRGAGPLAGAAGTVLEDAFQDHPHEDAYASNVSDGTARTSVRTFGSGRTVAETGESQELPQGNAAEGNETHPLTGPASAVPGVRTASETRVKSLTVDWYIKAADTVDAPEVVQALAYVASLNAVVSKAGELERVAKNRVVNQFSTQATYTAPAWTATSGIEIALFTTTIDNVKAGNHVQIDLSMFFECNHNVVLWLTRNGTDLLRGTGGGAPGANGLFTPTYDPDNNSTPDHRSLAGFIDTSPTAGSNTYRLMAQSSDTGTKTVYINRTVSGGTGLYDEKGSSWINLRERQA
ncbi:putative tail fiber-like protein [Roseibium sp. TrichSKD4]|uniref:hypothetical protein n=1 Tax=Roseibium sp. TrichSKD4 TaxID=744980 RepID=UPI0001E56F3D|nr:hypothetical protein [Roseibium sp. TrichSKD4]EFO31320.1 putative tail fiber-like protein [Roseibium sp. TrichSKD4]